jgi:hypothetical protein
VVTITCDTAFSAYFAVDEVGIDEHSMEQIAVGIHQGNIFIRLESSHPLWVYDVEGRLLVHKSVVPAGAYLVPVPNGVYIVKVGDRYIKKVAVVD